MDHRLDKLFAGQKTEEIKWISAMVHCEECNHLNFGGTLTSSGTFTMKCTKCDHETIIEDSGLV